MPLSTSSGLWFGRNIYIHVHLHISMGTKTISIMRDVYELLSSKKRKNESFSEVIRRTLTKKRSVMDFAGALNTMTDQEVENMKGEIGKLRKRSTRDLLKGI